MRLRRFWRGGPERLGCGEDHGVKVNGPRLSPHRPRTSPKHWSPGMMCPSYWRVCPYTARRIAVNSIGLSTARNVCAARESESSRDFRQNEFEERLHSMIWAALWKSERCSIRPRSRKPYKRRPKKNNAGSGCSRRWLSTGLDEFSAT